MMMQSLSNLVVCFDLDDTLYKEKDYLKSAFKEIAAHIARTGNGDFEKNFHILLDAFERGNFPFQEINTRLNIEIPTERYIEIYRKHKPDIHLSTDIFETLSVLKKRGCVLGLISDGRSVSQRNKIAALGLGQFFTDDNIVISGELGSEKPAERNYSFFSEKYKNGRFTYIGDNLTKDFVTPNRLGWTTICLLDNGQNIHKQDFRITKSFWPKYTVKTPKEIIDIIF